MSAAECKDKFQNMKKHEGNPYLLEATDTSHTEILTDMVTITMHLHRFGFTEEDFRGKNLIIVQSTLKSVTKKNFLDLCNQQKCISSMS